MRTQSVLSVLMYLFQNHMNQSCVLKQPPDELLDELEDVGFDKESSMQALSWLTDLINIQKQTDDMGLSKCSTRVYTDEEIFFIDHESRALLATLEAEGILTPALRELVIHSVMSLDADVIDAPLLKWVVLMVLFNQPERKDALQKMELLVLEGVHDTLQ